MAPGLNSGDLESKAKDTGAIVTFGWKNVSYSVPASAGTKQILRNVSGFIKSG